MRRRKERYMRVVLRIAVVGVLAVLVGCASPLSGPGSKVQILSASQAACYKFVGTVEESSALTGMWENSGYQNALNAALNKAASMAAAYLVIDNQRSVHRYWTTSEIVFGKAYKGPAKPGCMSQPSSPTNPQGASLASR